MLEHIVRCMRGSFSGVIIGGFFFFFIYWLDFIGRYFSSIKYSISFLFEFPPPLGSGPCNQKFLAGLTRSSLLLLL